MSERLGTGAQDIETAARALRAGRLVAFPTETVYGLGAIATDDRAVAAIFAAKRRPRFNPLIVHVADRAAARALACWNELAERLAARFWPGALTLVLPRAPGCPLSPLVSAGGDTVGLRVPAHPVAQALLEAAGLPVAAPSANPAGGISPTTADHVAEGLGAAVDLILDGGPCPIGLEFDRARPLRRRAPPAAAGRRDPRRARGRDRPVGRGSGRARPGAAGARASSRATTRRRGRCGSMPARSPPTRRCSPSARAAGGRAGDAQPERERRPRGGGGQSVRDAARGSTGRTSARSR